MVTVEEKDGVIMEESSGDVGGGGAGAGGTASAHEVTSTQPKHIRPTVRGKTKTKSMKTLSSVGSSDNKAGETAKNNSSDSDGNAMVEQTRIKMESWMGLGGGTKKEQKADDVPHGQPLVKNKEKRDGTKSILKKPKYSSKPMESVGIPTGGGAGGGGASAAAAAAVTASGIYAETDQNEDTDRSGQDGSSPTNVAVTSGGGSGGGGTSICKSFVVERDPSIAPLKKKKRSGTKVLTDNHNNSSSSSSKVTIKTNDLPGKNQRYSSIEGYVPSTTTTSYQSGTISSVADAGTSTAAAAAGAACNFGVAGTAIGTDTGTDGPATATTDGGDGGTVNGGGNEGPLILNSLAELFVAAQDETSYVPPENPHRIDENTQLVEADISFKVMSQKDFVEQKPIIEEQAETEHIRNIQRFLGRPRSDVFGEDDVDDGDDGNSENNSTLANARDGDDDDDDDDDDEALMEILMNIDDPGEDGDIDDESDTIEYSPEDDNLPDRQPRSFILLWRAITEWMTPQTVQWFESLQSNSRIANAKSDHDVSGYGVMKVESDTSRDVDTDWTPIVDQSDVGASRCAGVMAMLRLYLNGCLSELHQPIEMRRKVEKRLADLLRTFDYTRQNPHLNVDQWKALTCIFLEIILSNEDVDFRSRVDGSGLCVPHSVAAVGITEHEYRYLSKSSLATFAGS